MKKTISVSATVDEKDYIIYSELCDRTECFQSMNADEIRMELYRVFRSKRKAEAFLKVFMIEGIKDGWMEEEIGR
jgi:hypothetical protein